MLAYTYSEGVALSCDSNTLVQYRLKFQGLWTKAKFPKVYPESRPKAEWTSVIGEM